MAKILFICLLAVTAISAMPVADDPHPQLSVVPLAKIAEQEKPLLKQAEEINTEAAQPNEQLKLAEEKPEEIVIPKKSEEKKADELKPEEKSPAELLSQKPKEEKKIEEPKKMEDDKPEENQTAAPSEPIPEVKAAENSPAPVTDALANATATGGLLRGAEPVAAEHAQAKKIDEHDSVDKNLLKSNAEKPVIEGVKAEEKPDRVTRETEEAAKKIKAGEKKPEEEKKPVEGAAVQIEPVVAAEEKKIASPVSLIGEEKAKANELSEEKKSKGIQVSQGAAVLSEVASGLPEGSKKEADKPAELAAITESAKPNAEPTAAPKASEAEDEPLAGEAVPKGQRSEDVQVGAAKIAHDVADSHPAAIVKEQEKIVPAIVEKSSKSADEVKAEELPKPENVVDSVAASPKAAESELKPAEEKKIEKPIEKELKKDAIKEDEQKKESSEEDSSEEKKKEKKEEKKEMSEEKKESSEEDSSEKKDEKKMGAKKPELLAEPTTKAPSS